MKFRLHLGRPNSHLFSRLLAKCWRHHARPGDATLSVGSSSFARTAPWRIECDHLQRILLRGLRRAYVHGIVLQGLRRRDNGANNEECCDVPHQRRSLHIQTSGGAFKVWVVVATQSEEA